MQTLQSVLLAVEAEAEAAGWNSPLSVPMLFTLDRTKNGITVHWLDLMNDALNDIMATYGHSAEAALLLLAVASEKARAIRAVTMAADFIGLGFRAEGWIYENDDPNPIECRTVHFHDRMGSATVIEHDRDGELRVHDPADPAGVLPHAMTRILNAICPEGSPIFPVVRP